ncbi:osmotically-inducible lipoprotein OsmE [Pseudomonas alkylphenolica]|uniref:Osmotically-inducible lipoprotein OsmE n=1 Tax=Pseudomonas alkylphenolica TaxID=237609 RepID=A0A443ZYN4_9PSED|nr:osmotically-inducible lipoprotein OsmE [Pseudomonas alkylphenolica]RWU26380.1 osmotically-inducible lipoprotein OsmE [Pseudomonas alkylphenolica]
MYKQTLAILLTTTALAACGSRPENPVDYVTYRDQPLVKQVENGMTMQRVIAIGGSPSSVIDLPHGGTCNNYILNQEGHQQAYYVRFDATGHVDAKGFKTCEQRQTDDQAVEKAKAEI